MVSVAATAGRGRAGAAPVSGQNLKAHRSGFCPHTLLSVCGQGNRGRHLSGGLRLLPGKRVSRYVRTEPGRGAPGLRQRVRRLREALRPRPTQNELGTRCVLVWAIRAHRGRRERQGFTAIHPPRIVPLLTQPAAAAALPVAAGAVCCFTDEYLYQVCVRNGCKLPPHALAMIRYHSFYPWHTHGAYAHLAAPADALALHWVRQFNAHDLYSKSHAKQDVEALRPYYQRIIAKYFPDELRW